MDDVMDDWGNVIRWIWNIGVRRLSIVAASYD
ncbi:hypothetical protein LMG9964_00979 [Paraburkholderia phenoliruptrix]|uniref:Uncharacterized protein n=1 Tax=Paraburkholderia phenoliruptrix TaxID=252970 RepID=A0A6J5K0W2_9BURK|nr:hypothetical protein [Paraburkholderia phenoliruptrix]CAB4047347.1 hypothetical protein LMG9964_00979 [Paraburkholderia phenoliruptrix]